MLVRLVKHAQGVEKQIHRAPMDSPLIRNRAGDKLVDPNPGLLAILDDLNDSFLTGQLAAFGMMNFTRFKEQDSAGGDGAPSKPGPKSSTGTIRPRRKTTPAISGVVCGNETSSGDAISSTTTSRDNATRRVPT